MLDMEVDKPATVYTGWFIRDLASLSVNGDSRFFNIANYKARHYSYYLDI
jgi:hypothetical protein